MVHLLPDRMQAERLHLRTQVRAVGTNVTLLPAPLLPAHSQQHKILTIHVQARLEGSTEQPRRSQIWSYWQRAAAMQLAQATRLVTQGHKTSMHDLLSPPP